MINKKILIKFFTYTFFSGLAALVNFGSRFFYEMIPGVNFIVAVIFAYLSGMIVNFIFSKLLVFGSANTGKTKREAIKFFVIATIGLIVTVIVSKTSLSLFEVYGLPISLTQNLIGIEEHLDTLAHVSGMAVGLVSNFIGHELISFKETGMWNKLQNKLESKKNK